MAFTFFKKVEEVKPRLLEHSKKMKPVYDVPIGSDLEKQLGMLDLKKEDLAIAQLLQPFIREDVEIIVNAFYENLNHNQKLLSIINDHSSIERLKKALRGHIIGMFSGHMNEQYISKRKHIAEIHVRIGLMQKWYIASFEKLFVHITDIIRKNFKSEEDQFIAVFVVNKLINLEQQTVLEAYDDEINRLKELEERTKLEMIYSLERTSEELAALSEETNASMKEMTEQVGIITSTSFAGTEMAEEAKSAADEGRNRLNDMANTLSDMQNSTQVVIEDITSLEETSTEIRDIVNIVNSIAEQTNLLALNASIEAARAGEHGRGFAVVADEVRKLAEQTRQSVTDVGELIHQTNEQIATSASSMQEVEQYLKHVHEQMKVTETAFGKIDETMENTKERNQTIQEDLVRFDHVIREITESSTAITEAADGINRMIEKRINK